MHDFIVFNKAKSRDAIAVSLWNIYTDKKDDGESIIKCEERTEFEEIEYINGISPIGTDLYGNIVNDNTFKSVISRVYDNMSKKENPMSRRLATVLLDQIPKEGEHEKGYRPSQRIIDLYRPGVTVNDFLGKNPSDKDRLVFRYLGTEVAIIDTVWNKKRDGNIYSNSGNSLILTNCENVEKLREGKEQFTRMSGRKYHINEIKLKKAIGKHLKYTTKGYMWHLMQRRAEEYVKMMNSLLETSDEEIYEMDYTMTPENKRDQEIEKWINLQKSLSKNEDSKMSEFRREIIQRKFGDYSYENIRFAWNCKCIRQYKEDNEGKYPTASKYPKLSTFINNSSKMVNRIVEKLYNKEPLTENEMFKFKNLIRTGVVDRICDRMFNIDELHKAKEQFQKELDKSRAEKNKNKGEN